MLWREGYRRSRINDMKQDFDDYFPPACRDEVLDFIETAREEYHLENVEADSLFMDNLPPEAPGALYPCF